MLRTVLTLGLFALLGLLALKLVFGVLGGLLGAFFGLFFWLLGAAVKVALVGGVVYLAIRIVSPETARRLRARFSHDA